MAGKRVDLNSINKEKSPPLKLHLGCGQRYLKGYVNIDHRKTTATDIVCDIKKLPFADNSASLIEIYHVVEHLPRNNVSKAFQEWYRVLNEDGKIIIEFPDFDEAVKEYLAGNEKRIDNIFGLQRFPGDAHLFGYNFERVKKMLVNIGFQEITSAEPQDYHRTLEPCLRIEAHK